jgi:hypothetical protein
LIVVISPSAVVRNFHNGEDQEPLGAYLIKGCARLEARSGYDGPSRDDDSGPSYEVKQHAESARVATWLHFVRASTWDRAAGHGASYNDLDEISKACAYALYLPYLPRAAALFEHDGAPNHDLLDCWVKVRDEAATALMSWLDRSATSPSLMPEVTLHGLYFHLDKPIFRREPKPPWDDFLHGKRVGTFESYLISFAAERPS